MCDFLLLKVNGEALQKIIDDLDVDKLTDKAVRHHIFLLPYFTLALTDPSLLSVLRQTVMHYLFSHCCDAIAEKHPVKADHALQVGKEV